MTKSKSKDRKTNESIRKITLIEEALLKNVVGGVSRNPGDNEEIPCQPSCQPACGSNGCNADGGNCISSPP